MRIITIITLLLCALSLSAQKIEFSDIPLTWSNFRIVEGSNNNFSASVYTRIDYDLHLVNSESGKRFSLTTNCYVDNAASVVTRQFFEGANAIDRERCLQHEKGHFVICLIQQKKFQQLLEQHIFRNPIQREVDSLFTIIVNQMKNLNLQYDNATNHGKNGSQEQWEINLMHEFNKLYKDTDNLFLTETVLNVTDSFAKITDPAMYSYQNPLNVFEYHFVKNRVSKDQINTAFPVSIDTPYHRTQTDSTIYVDNIDFTRDFELELLFSFTENADKYTPGLALGWATQAVTFADWGNTAVSIAPGVRTFLGLSEKNKKKHKKVRSFYNLTKGFHTLTIRKIGDSYFTFTDGNFEKELICKPPTGKRIFTFAVKELGNLHCVRFVYL